MLLSYPAFTSYRTTSLVPCKDKPDKIFPLIVLMGFFSLTQATTMDGKAEVNE